jgi:hypothetical protein
VPPELLDQLELDELEPEQSSSIPAEDARERSIELPLTNAHKIIDLEHERWLCNIARQVRMLSYEMDCIRVRPAPDAAERIDALIAELLRIKRELEERLTNVTITIR